LTQRLNITNGDSAAATLSEAGVEGKIIPWRDVLHEGPVDSSLSLEELSKGRARFISEQGWDDFAHVSGDFAERDRVIRHLDYFDEVVLWFEDDLYDQLQLIQLLDFFGRGAARGKTLSVIVVDGYPATFWPKSNSSTKLVSASPRSSSSWRSAWKAFGAINFDLQASRAEHDRAQVSRCCPETASRGVSFDGERFVAFRARSA
jgi:hypothetical protein